MELTTSLLAYLVVAVLVFVIARMYRIRTFSALVLALVIAQIGLSLLKPDHLGTESKNGAGIMAYLLIQLITGIVVLTYVIGKALSDRETTLTTLW